VDTANSSPPEDKPSSANSSPPPDKTPEADKSKPLAWADLPTVLSGIAVFFTVLVSLSTGLVFIFSCFYLWGFESAFGLALSNYVDFHDYVTTLPTLNTSVAVILAVVATLYLLIVLSAVRAVISLPVYYRHIPKEERKRRFYQRSLIICGVCLLVGIVITFWLAASEGKRMRGYIDLVQVSEVFRKSNRCSIQGRLILHSGKYIFLWSKNSHLIVVPNEEVVIIETPSSIPSLSSTPPPVIVSPVKSITPSQTSPTPTPK
jgi:hypothetical protein